LIPSYLPSFVCCQQQNVLQMKKIWAADYAAR